MDSDFLTYDDFLGECRVPLSELANNPNEFRDYPLTGDGAKGSVRLMTGPEVEAALLQEAQEQEERNHGTFHQLSFKLG
eukprot:1138316-Prymnesium_polylepis.1